MMLGCSVECPLRSSSSNECCRLLQQAERPCKSRWMRESSRSECVSGVGKSELEVIRVVSGTKPCLDALAGASDSSRV